MKHLHKQSVLLLAIAILVPCQGALAQKKNIVILATGGTIAGAAATGTQWRSPRCLAGLSGIR